MITIAQAKALGQKILSTRDAANGFGYQQQTLRKWACYDNGPIRPIRIGGRLGWKVDDLERLLNGDAA